MKKLFAVIKHEYKRVVLKWSFLIATLLLPLIASMFAVVPAIIFSMKGEPTRIVIVDPSGKIAPRIEENLSPEKISAKASAAARESLKDLNATQQEKLKRSSEQLGQSFIFIDYDGREKSLEQVRRELHGPHFGWPIGRIPSCAAEFRIAGRGI